MADPILPRVQSQLLDANGRPTKEWYDFFRNLLELAAEQTDIDAAILALQEAVAELQAAEPELGQIFGDMSVAVQGILGQVVQLRLVNDQTTPDPAAYYGTNLAGTKGFHDILENIPELSSTGIRWGGVGTVDGGLGVSDEVSVTEGEGVILDTTDPENPVYTSVPFGPFPSVTVATSAIFTWWYVDAAGALQQTTTTPTPESYRERIWLFRTAYGSGVIGALVPIVTPLQNPIAQMGALARTLGTIISEGLRVVANGANLNLTRQAGALEQWGSNWNTDQNDPHYLAFTLQSPLTFRMMLSTGSPAGAITSLPVGFYESGGVVTAVPGSSNRATIFTVFQFASGNTIIQYDDTYYNTLAEAQQALTNSRVFPINPLVSQTDGIVSGYIIATKGATALNDTAQARFYATNRFGELGGAGVTATVATWGGITGTITNQADLVAYIAATSQPLDATLTALAGQNWALNALPIGTGADSVSQVAFAANTFPARASTGNLVAKTITDDALLLLADADVPRLGTANTWTGVQTVNMNTGAVPAPSVGTMIHLVQADGVANRIRLESYANFYTMEGVRYNNTQASPAALASGDVIFALTARGYTGSGESAASTLTFRTAENWSGSANGTILRLQLIVAGTTVAVFAYDWTTAAFYPASDNARELGLTTNRWSADWVVTRNTSGALYETGIQSPTTFAANTDNLALTSTTSILRIGASAPVNLTGVTGGASGRRLTITNISANNITLVHNATSTAANQFLCPGSANLVLNVNDSVELWYDSTSVRWRVIGV